MPDSTTVTDSEHSYSLRIPGTTPTGQPVQIDESRHEGMHRVHASSPDESELYFEIVSYPRIIDHERAVAEQRDSLASRAPDAAMTATRQSFVRTFGATEFQFAGTLAGRRKVRRFIFLDSATRTYRIIYDPRSDVNEQLLDSIAFEPERGA